jgi:hypothetical protein
MRPTAEDLQILRDRLPRGSQVKIAQRLKKKGRACSTQTVSDALNGKITNMYVIEEAILYAEELENEMKAILKRIRAPRRVAA